MSKFLKLIYSNKLFCLLMMLVQFAIIFVISVFLTDNTAHMYTLMNILGSLLIIYEINRDEEPGFKLTWVMLIAVIPVFGALLYLFLHYNKTSRRIAAKSELIKDETIKYTRQEPSVLEELKNFSLDDIGVSRYVYKFSGFPVYNNSSVKYFPLGDDMFVDLKDELRHAEKFIFIEMFIINPRGRMWPEILDILKQKAASGVEIRLLYDGMGCMNLLPGDYDEVLRKIGIGCRIFSPIVPLFSTYQNNRDHRKNIIIDGRAAYTGGVNFADEYINERERFGHWKDNAIKICGAAVAGFTSMFLQMWNVADKKLCGDDYGKYITAALPAEGKGFVMPFADSPLKNDMFGETMYMNNLNLANSYVYIMTPYLVLGTNMLTALKNAARRGVSVKIILPHIPDKPYAFWLAGTYYKELIENGVEIYEYIPGFVHAKMSVSDDKRAIVGTINHDYRSLYLHYECAAYMVGVPEIGDMKNDFIETLAKCKKITVENYKERSLLTRGLGKLIRLIAPLL